MPEVTELPTSCSVVHCRSHRWLVEDVEPAELPEGDTVVRLACLDDDANGQRLEVFWQREVDRQVLGSQLRGQLHHGRAELRPRQPAPAAAAGGP